jgi:hypothetical protein
MLVEFWERLRGYDKWPCAEAKITTAKVKRTAHNGRDGSVSFSYASADRLEWIDFHGQKQSAEFKIHDDSPLYQFIGRETVALRYDPGNSHRFYFPELLRTRIYRACKLTLYTLAFIAFVGALFALNLWTSKH